MVVNEETHNWYRELVSLEYSVINGASIPHTYTPRLRVHLRRQGGKSVRAIDMKRSD